MSSRFSIGCDNARPTPKLTDDEERAKGIRIGSKAIALLVIQSSAWLGFLDLSHFNLSVFRHCDHCLQPRVRGKTHLKLDVDSPSTKLGITGLVRNPHAVNMQFRKSGQLLP